MKCCARPATAAITSPRVRNGKVYWSEIEEDGSESRMQRSDGANSTERTRTDRLIYSVYPASDALYWTEVNTGTGIYDLKKASY